MKLWRFSCVYIVQSKIGEKMKNKILTLAALTALTPLWAQEPPPPPPDNAAGVLERGKREPGMDPALRIQIIKQFDADGDGRLNKEEREAAERVLREKRMDLDEMKAKHARNIIAKFDSDGDGKLDEKEVMAFLDEQRRMMDMNRKKRANRRGNFAMPKDLLAKYDKDGDGRLSLEERRSMHDDMRSRREALLKKYDADGDGKLNDAERSELIKDPEVQAMMKRMMGDRLQGPPPPPAEPPVPPAEPPVPPALPE